jgi:hypothetical protein
MPAWRARRDQQRNPIRYEHDLSHRSLNRLRRPRSFAIQESGIAPDLAPLKAEIRTPI